MSWLKIPRNHQDLCHKYYHEIIILVIGCGFNTALFGCMIFTQRGLDLCFQPDVSSLKYFKDECQKFSKIGLKMSENMCGSDSVLTKKWKERNDLERWMAQDEKLWFNFEEFWGKLNWNM